MFDPVLVFAHISAEAGTCERTLDTLHIASVNGSLQAP